MLAESLILSKLNYGIVLYKNARPYFIKRIQRLQNAAAGYVLMRHSNEKDVISLNWLLIIELIDFKISKLAHKALCDDPGQIIYRWIEKNLLETLDDSNMIERLKENQTFHDNAEKVFSKLPLSIREKRNYKIF